MNIGNDPRNLPSTFTKRRYYTTDEVKVHNTPNDIWVSIFYEVFNLTELVQKNYSPLIDPIIKCAGTDISHWFDPISKDVI
jgi:hypothetical protein